MSWLGKKSDGNVKVGLRPGVAGPLLFLAPVPQTRSGNRRHREDRGDGHVVSRVGSVCADERCYSSRNCNYYYLHRGNTFAQTYFEVVTFRASRGVGPLVRRNFALGGEAHRAHGTSEGVLAGVGPFVPQKVALDGEPVWTHRASVGLLAGVGPLVLGNRALLGEALRVDRVGVGLLACGRTPTPSIHPQ